MPVSAIILAGIAMRAQRRAGERVNRIAIAGLVLGTIFSSFGVMFMLHIVSG